MEVDVRPLALLLVGVASLAVGCGSAAVTNTAVVSPASTNAALPLSEAEHDFVEEVQTARPTVDTDVRTLVGYGNAACTAQGSGGTEAAIAAVTAAGPVDDATARAVVTAATEHLCPGASARSTTTPPPTTTTTAGVAAGAGAGAGVPRRIAAPARTTTAVPKRTTPRPPTPTATATATSTTRAGTPTSEAASGGGGGSAFYKNCAAARAAGAAPIRAGEAGYRPALDSDKNGVACEN
jgi:Excalibur calcium-binding domain/Protein of unknown function (DUF732)